MTIKNNSDSFAQIIQAAQEHNGIITAEIAREYDITVNQLIYATSLGKIEKSARGVYILPECLDDVFYNIAHQYKRGIFTLNTALYLHDLSDRTPEVFEMAFPTHYNTQKLTNKSVVGIREIHKFFGVGAENVITPGGHNVRAYGIERTLCDIVRPKHKIDAQIISEAFKAYSKLPEKNLRNLGNYAQLLGVSDVVNKYMEVLL
jgi:predicted transcriptional regulator of viral defense system